MPIPNHTHIFSKQLNWRLEKCSETNICSKLEPMASLGFLQKMLELAKTFHTRNNNSNNNPMHCQTKLILSTLGSILDFTLNIYNGIGLYKCYLPNKCSKSSTNLKLPVCVFVRIVLLSLTKTFLVVLYD